MMSEDTETSGAAEPRVQAAFPLTPLQEGMLYHALRAPGAGLYHGQCVVQLVGHLSVSHFRDAWRLAARRHEAFRTFFAWERRERPLQVVLSHVTLELEMVDWSALSELERGQQREELQRANRQATMLAGLDSGRAPMMRWVLARLDDELHELHWSFNHAVFDGWSALLVLQQVQEDYDDLLGGRTPRGRVQPPSYARFVSWLEGRRSDSARAFWHRALQGFSRPTPLPAPDGAGQSTERVTAEGPLPASETRSLRAAAARHRVTVNSMLMAAWGTVLGVHAATDDVVVGMTLSERPSELPGVQEAAGLYLSTIPVRMRLDREEEVGVWLRRVQTELADARAHTGPSLTELQRWAGVTGEGLFQTLVVFENFPSDITGARAESALTVRSVEVSGPSDLPLVLLALPGDRLRLQLVHDPARISVARANALLDDVRAALDALSEGEPQTVGTMLDRLGRAAAPAPSTLSGVGPALRTPPTDVIALFEAQAARTPDEVAIRAGNEALSYRALDEAAEAVARCLQSARLRPGSLVGLVGARSPDMIAAMLGALKAQCAYAPIDPMLPPSRMQAMAGELHTVLVLDGIDDGAVHWPVPQLRWRRTQADDLSVLPRERRHAPEEQAAYVIHTSGSTGEPKGVVVSRGQLAWSTAARFDHYGTPPEAFLLLSSLSVDSAVAGIYWTLCSGGALVLPETGAEQDMEQLTALIEAHRVTDTLLVPSLYRELLDAGAAARMTSLRRVVVAGEACPEDVVRMHLDRIPGASLHNEYGPSEATVWATVDDLSGNHGADRDVAARHELSVTIGRPVALARVYLVDSRLRQVPFGDVGEILLGGPGIALGYLGQSDLTAERFLPDPWSPGGRVYRTGDRGRWRADGRLEFLGRVDHQIKVRGFRVEPVEVETVLQAHPRVAESLVGLASQNGSAAQLVALLQCAGDPPLIEELEEFLRDRLPQHMIPSRFHVVERLPRTAAGKLDRSAIASRIAQPNVLTLKRSRAATTARTAPRTETERVLVEIWKDVLGVQDVGVHDDFFAIGGDSLLSIRAISRSARAGIPISPASFFAGPSIAQIALAGSKAQVAQDAVTGAGDLTPIQHWFFEQFGEHPDRWNQAFLLRPLRPVPRSAIERATAALLRHHDALRLRFERGSDAWRATFGDPSPTASVRWVDMTDVPAERRPERIEAVADEVHADLELEAGNLFRVVVFDDRGGDQRVLLLAHHLVIDALSWGIVLDDFAALLEAADGETLPALPPKTHSFREWASALRSLAANAEVEALATRWTDAAHESWELVPREFPASARDNRSATARHHVVRLGADLTREVLDLANRPTGASVQELLLAGLMTGWKRWTGQPRLQLDLESHGRDLLGPELDVSRTVGWFTCVHPVRLQLRADGARSALDAVRAALPGSARRRASYGLLRYLHPEPSMRQRIASLPESEVLFNYLGSLDGLISKGSPFVLSAESLGRPRSAEGRRAYVLEINSWIDHGRLTLDIEYSTVMHRPESMARLGAAVAEGIRLVTRASSEPRFGLAALDEQEFGRLADLLAGLDGD